MKTTPNISSEGDISPVPPNPKAGEHHWLMRVDSDGHEHGLIVLQWNPGVQRWSHSGQVGTGLYVNTEGWRYVALCPLPPFSEGEKAFADIHRRLSRKQATLIVNKINAMIRREFPNGIPPDDEIEL